MSIRGERNTSGVAVTSWRQRRPKVDVQLKP